MSQEKKTQEKVCHDFIYLKTSKNITYNFKIYESRKTCGISYLMIPKYNIIHQIRLLDCHFSLQNEGRIAAQQACDAKSCICKTESPVLMQRL